MRYNGRSQNANAGETHHVVVNENVARGIPRSWKISFQYLGWRHGGGGMHVRQGAGPGCATVEHLSI